jgi:hypothetical protein
MLLSAVHTMWDAGTFVVCQYLLNNMLDFLRDPILALAVSILTPIISGVVGWSIRRRREVRQEPDQIPIPADSQINTPTASPDIRHNSAAASSQGTNTKAPVWEVYDLLRTARLNVLYWATLLRRTERKYRWLEILTAISVSAASVVGVAISFGFFGVDTSLNWYIWLGLILIASLSAVLTPFLQLPESIRAYEASVSRYQTIENQLSRLRREIQFKKVYDQQMQNTFEFIRQAMSESQDIEPYEELDEKLRNEVFERVNRELPSRDFFVPS